MRFTVLLLAIFAVLCLAAPGARAATVEFENGDRLTGETDGFENGRLRLRTAHAGVVLIDLAGVAAVDGVAPGFEPAPAADGPPAALAHQGGIEAEIEVLGEGAEAASPWSGQVELGAHYSSGNSDRRGFHARLLAVREDERTKFEGKIHALYAEEDGDRAVNEQFLSLRGDLKDLPWYYFALLSFERDEFEDLDLRAIFSPGIGYFLANSESFLAKIEAGPAFTYVDYKDDSGEFDVEARVGFYAEAKVFDNAKIIEDLQIYPSLTEFGEFRLTSETSFEQPLSEVLFVKLSILNTYDSDVPDGVERHDLKLLASLIFKF